jgi:hypothetical protein
MEPWVMNEPHDHDRTVDHRRADVFGLGAIRCEILTGEPPYVGRSGEEVRRKAANGDLADATARLDACGADLELVGLAKVCLAPVATDRPKDAHAVADALSAYQSAVQERLEAANRERGRGGASERGAEAPESAARAGGVGGGAIPGRRGGRLVAHRAGSDRL